MSGEPRDFETRIPDLWAVLVEGAVDRCRGVALDGCPYSITENRTPGMAWRLGWALAGNYIGSQARRQS